MFCYSNDAVKSNIFVCKYRTTEQRANERKKHSVLQFDWIMLSLALVQVQFPVLSSAIFKMLTTIHSVQAIVSIWNLVEWFCIKTPTAFTVGNRCTKTRKSCLKKIHFSAFLSYLMKVSNVSIEYFNVKILLMTFHYVWK